MDLEDQLLSHCCWNYTGKLIAGAVDNMVNIWTIAGNLTAVVCNIIQDSCFYCIFMQLLMMQGDICYFFCFFLNKNLL